jgi:hypothetical protein
VPRRRNANDGGAAFARQFRDQALTGCFLNFAASSEPLVVSPAV